MHRAAGHGALLPVHQRSGIPKSRRRGSSLVQVIVAIAVLLCCGYGLFAVKFLSTATSEPKGRSKGHRELQETGRTKVADPDAPGVIHHVDGEAPARESARKAEQKGDRRKRTAHAPVTENNKADSGRVETDSGTQRGRDVVAPVVAVESEANVVEPVHAPVTTTPQRRGRADSHAPAHHSDAAGLFALTAVDIDGVERHLSEFAGKVVLVVNVASACGFTDENYKGLMKTYNKYRKFGLEVLGFPCNQFGEQEPGSHQQIKEFCTSKYHVDFPMFSKVDVNGPQTHPVFEFLKRELPTSEGGGGGHGPGSDLTWNFNKFLVNKHGYPEKFFYQGYDIAAVEHEVYRMLQAL